jgi:hypothetical protein
LLYIIFLFIGPRYPVILLCWSMVILDGAFSTHLPEKERNRNLGGVKGKHTSYGGPPVPALLRKWERWGFGGKARISPRK